jgi:tetratricopeptide (TPR) repeat protein
VEKKIQWETDIKTVLTQAKALNKPILLFIMNPPCPSCQEIEKVTFSNEKVIEFINKNVVPLHIVAPESQDIVKNFNLKRTPMWLILDSEGVEHHRTIGFFPPEEIIPSMMLGIAKAHFDQGQFDQALSTLEKLFAEYPEDDSIPEAIYLQGGIRFKSTRDRRYLRESYEQLRANYPTSAWTKRAYPYRIILMGD